MPSSWVPGVSRSLSIAPGASSAPNTDRDVGGFFYVISGQGKATIGDETADIADGDAIPIMLNDTKSFENTGTEPIELMHVGIVSDMSRRNELLNGFGGARGIGGGPGPGRGRGRGEGAPVGSGRGAGR